MSKKKVISLISIAVFVVLAISASVISYSIANRESGSKDIQSGVTNRGSAISGNMEYITNIDRIIENSYAGENFNIVEILPAGVTNDALSKYVSTGKFKSYVIDANREGSNEMKANMIRHQIINVNSTTALTDTIGGDTIQSILDSADLIYISSPNYTSYTGTNNMSEDVYNWLHNYALANYKPVIMDYVTQSSGGSSGPTMKTYAGFVNAVSSNYIKYRTFYWNVGKTSADEFFNSKNDSYYLKYNVNLNTANGKVLVLSNNGGGEAIQTLFEGYAGIIANAYYGRDSGKPKKLTYEVKVPAAITAADLSGYDFIILENSIMSAAIDDSIYTALKTLSETSKYIIYDKKNITTTSVTPDVNTSNYLKLMDLLISNKGVSRYVNVLPVSYGFFTSLNNAGEDGKEAAKNIADLINSSDYRGSMTSGANGKVFRVLELQPCYPIDMELALTKSGMKGQIATGGNPLKGNYYTNPSQVLSGVSEDQVDEDTEYYKFELSKAKLVKATGLKYSQIVIDQMSTEAFISDKDVVLETYDLVYVGGNTTALTPYTLKSFYSGNYGTLSLYQSYSISKYLTSFDMYTHTGNVSQLFTYGSQTSQNAGDAYGTLAEAKAAGLVTNAVLNGNDLTLNKLNELKAYVDAGMPIIFSDRVSETYEKVADKSRLEQLAAHDIDPDSRMFKLLKYAKDKKDKGSSSILWNLDISSYNKEDDYNFNEDNMYGPAVTNYVTLFNDKTNTAIANAILDSTTRPSLKIISKPKDYVEGNTNTYNVNEDGSMTIKASAKPSKKGSSTFDLQLYIDMDGNGTFTEKEKVSSSAYTYKEGSEESAELTYTFEYDDFFGLVSWKVVAAETDSTGACDVATGYAYYKRNEDTDKKDVNVLQIMPMDNVANPSDNYGQSDGHSLYLCTECQMAKYRAKYNLSYNGDVYLNTTGVNETFRDVKMGRHEHKFGIVKFDTAGLPTSSLDKHGSEDWDSNFADILADDYNFSTDILFVEEVQEYSKIIADNSVTDADGNKVLTTTSVDENGNPLGTDIDGNPITVTWVDYYTAKADDYYSKWESAKAKLEASDTEKKLEAYIKEKAAANPTVSANGFTAAVTKDLVQQWIDHKAYYRFFYYYGFYDGTFNGLYQNWVAYHDPVVENRQAYAKYSCLSNTSDDWLYNNYDVVVLGFAEDFGGKDLSLQNCTDIKSYVGKGGTLLTTHDSTTRYETTGAVNLTNQLRSLFGMDRFHVTGTADDAATPPYQATEKNAKELILKDNTTGRYYGPVYLTDKNMTADIVLDENEVDSSDVGNNEKVYDAYRLTEGTKVNPGGNFNVTFNIYDTVADAEAGRKTATNHSYQVCYFAGWNIQYLAGIGISGGTGTYNGYSLETVSVPGPLKYRKYITEDPDLYYFTELSTIGSDTLADRVLWQNKMTTLSVGNGGSYYGIISPVGITDAVGIFETTSNNSSPYKYVEYNQQEAITWNKDLTQGANSGTNRASQNNTGIVTTYPFTISSELRISGTHTQNFALDLEQEGIAVWYTLAGCDGSKARSSLFAADPYDGMDAYFLYSYYHDKGAINYCGAGHTVVTGPNKDNNDERRLYINIIVNAVRNKGSKPKITVHEKDKANINLKPEMEDTNPTIDEAGNYTYNVNSKEDTPEFDYKIKVNSQTTLAEAYVFYDLNYAIDTGDYSNKYTKDNNHVLLYHYKAGNAVDDEKKGYINIQSAAVTVGKLRQDLFKPAGEGAVDPLKLKPEYFDPYGNYTYIVIWAKDQNGKTSFQRIKINLIPYLFDLTDAEFERDTKYLTSYSFRMDISDRMKYNI